MKYLLIFFMKLLSNGVAGQSDCSSRVERIYIKDSVVPVKGQSLQLNCIISNFKDSSNIDFSRSDLPVNDQIATCIPSQCLLSYPWNQNYEASSNSSGVYLQIQSLNRTEDQNTWICLNPCSEKKTLQFTVHTVPQILQLDSPPSQDQDLVKTAVTLKCRTGCAYPKPEMKWFYSESGGSRQQWSASGSTAPKAGGCTDSEKIYTSTLNIEQYTTFPDNGDKSVKFSCGIISFPGLTQPLYTDSSVNVRFAVRVTSVTLMDGTSTPAEQLTVVSGRPKTLTCETSVSRPTATIVWYIGTEEKQRSSTSSSYTFVPQNKDNNKQIYCKAFNIQQEKDAVSSNKVTLYILVVVTDVTLKDDSSEPREPIELIKGVSKTLTCTTSVSRPTATIAWYIGTDMRQSSSSLTFTFTAVDADHNKQIFCKANNTKVENEAVYSKKFMLYVKVHAGTPTIQDQTTENRVVLENDTIKFECTSSITRPAALVSWRKGSDTLTNVNNSVKNHTRDFVSVTSVVTFTSDRNDNNKKIICETYIPRQEPKPTAQQGITVYWPPATPYITTTNVPFLEGQTGKSIYCSSTDYGNPSSTAEWINKYGTPDNTDSMRLNLPTLSSDQNGMSAYCQLKNSFTEQKSLQIRSTAIRIVVEYTPVVKIQENSTVINSIMRNEGQGISVLCNAHGNPTPTISWTGQSPGSVYLRIDDLDRSDHGTYTCKASAESTYYPQHDFVTEKTLAVIVNYAPVVTVDLSNRDPEENSNLKISCKATGRPADYTYKSLFQTWGTVKISNTHLPVNGVIDIQNLQLEDSGTYTCLVNNGIQDRNNHLDQTGNVTVKIKVSPKLLLDNKISTGAVGTSVNISAPFYSYPDIHRVEFRFPNGTQISNSNKYDVSFYKSVVSDEFYGKTVELEGYVAVLQIKNEVETDFMNYTLILDNGIGSPKEWTLKHISESLPSVPKIFNFSGLVKGIPTFLLFGGFNGGRQQTFVIETAIAGTDNWVEQLRFNETDRNFLQNEKLKFIFNITGLMPNTYEVRALVGNQIGWIAKDEAPKLQFTINKEEKEPEPSPVGAIAGGIGAAVVAFIIVVVVVVFVKKRRSKKKGDSSTAINGRKHVDESDSSDDEVMTENLAYVSADEVRKTVKSPGADGNDIYAQPHKTGKKTTLDTGDLSSVSKMKAEDPRTLYALPVKKDQMDKKKNKQKEKKDLKKGKQNKNKNEDVYENASELTPVKTKASKGSKYAYDENPYENPEESKPSRKNVNKDGLIYADLTFNEQPKGQKKLVIHGLDSMTEYVEVDFTKKAEPLPDSDEETGNKN